jgi:hypothetical protein
MTSTYQKLIDADMTVTAFCHNRACGHHRQLDLVKMRDKFGPDAPATRDDIVPKLRCSACGGREIGLVLSPRSNEKRQAQTPKPNRYEKAKGQ